MIWLILGPLLVLSCLFFLFPAFISKGNPRAWNWHVGALVGLWMPMFNYNLLGGSLFEEFGWRGFLQSHLQRVLPPWIAAICVGIMWAAWHLPLFREPRLFMDFDELDAAHGTSALVSSINGVNILVHLPGSIARLFEKWGFVRCAVEFVVRYFFHHPPASAKGRFGVEPERGALL